MYEQTQRNTENTEIVSGNVIGVARELQWVQVRPGRELKHFGGMI